MVISTHLPPPVMMDSTAIGDANPGTIRRLRQIVRANLKLIETSWRHEPPPQGHSVALEVPSRGPWSLSGTLRLS